MENLFRQLGLSDNEREVYLAVFKAGKITPYQVAQKTGIHRTTVYSVAKKLSQIGLIIQDLGQKVNYLVAAPPEKLISLFEKEEKELKKKKKVAQTLAQERKTLFCSSYPICRRIPSRSLSLRILSSLGQ